MEESANKIPKKTIFRIILYLPASWLVYELVANFLFHESLFTLLNSVGPNLKMYVNVILFLVFFLSGSVIAPNGTRVIASVLIIVNYLISYGWSIFFIPILLNEMIENYPIYILINYSIAVVPIIASQVITYKYYKYNENK